MQTQQESPARVALIGFGEAASAFVEGWRKALSLETHAFDIKTANPSEAVRAGKWEDYRRCGVSGADTPAGALAGAGIVFSLVTADQALAAATSTAPHLEPGAFFFDCNSCSPGTKRRAAEAVMQASGRLHRHRGHGAGSPQAAQDTSPAQRSRRGGSACRDQGAGHGGECRAGRGGRRVVEQNDPQRDDERARSAGARMRARGPQGGRG